MTSLAHVARLLLPPGRALSRREASGLGQLLEGMAVELERVDERVKALASDVVTDDQLDAWTVALGIDPQLSPSVRRARILAQLIGTVDCSRAAYDAAAAALGLVIDSVDTYLPFEADRSAAGEVVRDDSWLHRFDLNVARPGATGTRAAGFVAVSEWQDELYAEPPAPGSELRDAELLLNPDFRLYDWEGRAYRVPPGSSRVTLYNGLRLDPMPGWVDPVQYTFRRLAVWPIEAVDPGEAGNQPAGAHLSHDPALWPWPDYETGRDAFVMGELSDLAPDTFLMGPNAESFGYYVATMSDVGLTGGGDSGGAPSPITSDDLDALERIIRATLARAHTLVRVLAAP